MGDPGPTFSIQSVSKAFVFALVCDALGPEAVLEPVGVNNTGLPFNSVMALELNGGSPMNPMVNAGALATTSLVPGADRRGEVGVRAGGPVRASPAARSTLDEDVYASEAAHNRRNQAIARLLESYGRMRTTPTRPPTSTRGSARCSSPRTDLAVMGATLADGGVNPVTGERVVDAPSASTSSPPWPPAASTSAPASGCSASGCPARAGCPAASSPSRPARGAWAPSRPGSTRPATACAAVLLDHRAVPPPRAQRLRVSRPEV